MSGQHPTHDNPKWDNAQLWEEAVAGLARTMDYPPTPDFMMREQTRLAQRTSQPRQVITGHRWRPVWVTLLLCGLLLLGLLSVPPVRAAVWEWLQIGAVRISPQAETPVVVVETTVAPTARPTVTRMTTPVSMKLDFTGETTLAEAIATSDFPLSLPAVPADLGPPDHVYLQRAEGDLVIFVWMADAAPEQVRMSLHILGPGAFVWKMAPPTLSETTINGERAIWTEGPYYIQAGGSWANRRLVNGHVLVWTDGPLTYRLESTLSFEEAVAVAESLMELE